MSAPHVAIVGAGFSGAATALHLARRGISSTLIERERVPARGTAYGTTRPEHLLNVTARRMIVAHDDPLDFARWLEARGGREEDYAQRRQFGDYMAQRLEGIKDAVTVVAGEAVAVESDGREHVVLADGRSLDADAVVLALGNFRPAPLAGFDTGALEGIYVADPWFGGSAEGLGPEDTVLLIGTGLTAVDTILTLDASGFAGRVVALSRRGLLPRGHLPREPVAEPAGALPRGALALLSHVRRRAEAIGWREAVHELRNVSQQLWMDAPQVERRRFLRHLRAWWDVHRHRIAPAIADRLETLQAEGRLQVVAGRITGVERDGDEARIAWRPRGRAEEESLRAARIVNCTGPELDIRRAGDPLLDALVTAGRIRPDSCRLGIDVDRDCRVIGADGSPSSILSAIGPMTRGAFWESIAVAEIARQAEAVADRIAARTPVTA